MPPLPDVDELAAVVADGRPFDWADLDDTRGLRPLKALWRAVRHVEGERQAQPAAQARLSTPFFWIAVAALLKAAVTVGFVALAIQSVDPAQLVTLASFTLVGAVLLYGGHRDVRARRLGVVLVLLGSVMTKPLLRQVSEAGLVPPMLFKLLQGVVLESLLPVALWRFAEVFPQAVWSPRDATWLRRGLATSTLLGWLLLAGNMLLAAGFRDIPSLWMLDRDATITTYFWPLLVGALVPALLLMLRRRRDAGADERGKVTAFIAALVLALLPAALIILLFLTPVRTWMLSHDALTGVLMYSGLVAMPLATGYAVVAHGVLRVELVLRNAARHALARGLLLVLTAGPLVLLAMHGYRNAHLPVGALFGEGTGRALLAVSAFGAVLLGLRERIQGWVDRALRRDTVSLADALDAFARRSGEGLGLGGVAEAMHRTMIAAFHPEVVGLLVADRARDAFVPLGATMAPLPRATWLAQSLAGVREPVIVDLEDADGVARLLPPSDQDWLADAGVVVLAPLVAGGGTLCGLVALGPMASGRRYTDDDLQYLGALAGAAAPAIESRLLRNTSTSTSLDDVRWDDESGRECPACGRAFPADVNTCAECERATAPMGIPVRLHGKFSVIRRLGAGGMGVAYLAADDALGRQVVLKALPRVRPETVEQLRREARAMAQVSHPALATIHGLESWRAVPVLVVEYLPGGTLADRLRHGPVHEVEIIGIVRHVLGGLRRLHESGLLHRDLKPSNIGFAADGSAKVLDFGLSRLRSSLPERPEAFGSSGSGVSPRSGMSPDVTSLAGTPAYLSPELVAGHPPAPRDDVWALAVMMLEALQGRHPWASWCVDDVLGRLRSGAGPDWAEGRPRCSNELAAILSHALSRDETTRSKSAEALGEELARLPH